MAALGQTFEASQHESMEERNYDPIPNGVYKVMITASEIKDTKNNDGRYVSLTFEIVEGDYKGRKLFNNLNLWNKSAQAVAIAQKELKTICDAVRKPRINDTCELHDIVMQARVVVGKRKDTGEPQNEIKMYAPIGANMDAKAEQPTASASAGGGQKRPWEK